MDDGLELSANLWLPVARPDVPDERFPAVLEILPYRKDDWHRPGDERRGRWLAARGFALCRLDVRGTGSSPGIAADEYTARETQDGYLTVEWLAAQPWSNGNVGMWGISYGGFTSIQVAKLRPPHLRAIVPMYATDDRYLDDVHYVGGCVTVSELSQYAVSMVGMNALPARPAFRGEAWLDEWRARLDGTPVWLFEWLRQQHDGPYWRQGSLAPEYEALEAATFLIGGWMDSYPDPVLRMLERCVNAPRKALIGNWVHDFPDDAYPGPNLDWLHEMVRFFDHWLKGIDNGVMDEPALTCFIRDYAPPEPFPRTWPGRWRSEPSYPATRGERNGAVAERRRRAAGRPTHRRAGRRRRCRPLPAPRHHRYPDGPLLGRRQPAERVGPRPAPGRRARADLHRRAVDRAHRDPGQSGGRPVDRGLDAGRDGGGPAGRRRAGWHRRPGRRGRAQPHPSRVAPGTDAAGARPALRGPRSAARRRVSVRSGASDPPVARLELLAGPVAVAVSGRARPSTTGAPGWSCRPSRPTRSPCPARPSRPARPASTRSPAATASHRSGGSTRMSSRAP